ncbi:AAA family ATPase [Runella sp.]|uniref:AAA family ATPase n=1 Tax=Runella sp. TaxID=1960881 RepID=UPI003D100FD4
MENQPNYIRGIVIENVRCFGNTQWIYFTENNQFEGKIAMWNVILGNNGTGKTTILRSITKLHYAFFENNQPVFLETKHKEKEGTLALHAADRSVVAIKIQNFLLRENTIINANQDLPPIFGYGASRKIGTFGIAEEQDNFPRTLFSDEATLLNAEDWLIQAEYLSLKEGDKYKRRYEIIKDILQKLLKDEISEFSIKTENNTPKVFFKTHYGEVRLHDLSLGYKTLIAWVTDLARGLVEKYPDSINPLAEPAICLVDEIDLHMHPQMQRNVIKFLRETFPKTQFICTAHSPLIVQSGADANLILLRRNGEEVEVVNAVDDAKNWRVDQILDSDLFENVSSYAPSVLQKVNKRREILLKDKPSKKDKAELSKLDASLDNLSVTESPEYLQALKILSKVQKNG